MWFPWFLGCWVTSCYILAIWSTVLGGSRFYRTFHRGRKFPFLELGEGSTWSAFVGSGSIGNLLVRVPESFLSDTLLWWLSSSHSSLLALPVEAQMVFPGWVSDVFHLWVSFSLWVGLGCKVIGKRLLRLSAYCGCGPFAGSTYLTGCSGQREGPQVSGDKEASRMGHLL